MGATVLSHDFGSLSRQPPSDPDIQSTLSDFLTYTEHFPSQLTRALSLIDDQRRRAEQKIKSVHDDATTWSLMPTLKGERPDPVKLRRNISYALEEAERASLMALEEATRLDEACRREAKRLDVVTEKLKAQPMPPSRDATPEQQALTSPNLKKERTMSTRADDARPERPSRKLQDRAATKLRGRKIMVPGEVLPPPDPNAQAESISDWTSPRPSPPLEEPPIAEKDKRPASPRQRSRTPRTPKPEKDNKKGQKSRNPRAPGQPGTNAHSAVAGISTSNALLALTKPPEGAEKGSVWLPWMKLTEWEMAKLRKRMKKNAIWVPSHTMVRRELKNLGRGTAGKEAARKEAEATGKEFIDESYEGDPTKVLASGEESNQANSTMGEQSYETGEGDNEDQELVNRGMMLNEAKKLKRQRMLEEQALQAQIAREQGIEPTTDDVQATAGAAIETKDAKKRKRDSTPTVSASAVAASSGPQDQTTRSAQPKKLRITAPATIISKVPLAPAGVSSPRATAQRYRRAATPPATGRKPSLVLKAGKAVSEEPPSRRATLRRNSNVSLPNSTTITSPVRTAAQKASSGGRRSRRPAPGILTSAADDGGAKVGVSKRKAAPRKRGTGAASRAPSDPSIPEIIPEEEVDPDEPRYCLCGDVSWGTMIACDNDDNCDKEWFHLSCVDLDELPPRRTKWYCPECRKKLKLGVGTNGLVGRTSTGR